MEDIIQIRVGHWGFYAMQTCSLIPVFWRNILLPSSELKKERRKPAIRTDKLKGWERNTGKHKAGWKVQSFVRYFWWIFSEHYCSLKNKRWNWAQVKFHKTRIVPVLIYRLETWTLKICFFKVLQDQNRSDNIRKELGVYSMIKTPSLHYQSDHLNKTEDHILNTLLSGRRNVGRPRMW